MMNVVRSTRSFIFLVALVAIIAACGNPPTECPSNASCKANGTEVVIQQTRLASSTAPAVVTPASIPPNESALTTASSTTFPTYAPQPIVTPSPEPSTPIPPPPSAVPSETPSWTPTDPSQVTPRPTDPPFTPKPRPRMPIASDIHLAGDGKYIADVDGCHWAEFGRFSAPGSTDTEVGMATPCLPEIALHFNLRTKEIVYTIA